MSAAEWVPESPTLSDLRSAVQKCRGCELYRDATQGVMGEGRTPAPLMLLGEQPGDREDREGEPCVGPAGGILHEALAEAGIEPEATYTTNVVKHFRHRLAGKRRIHRSPTSKQVGACAPWLAAELDLVRPTGVILLGGTAGKALYGSSFRVGEARGHRRAVAAPVDERRPRPAQAVNEPQRANRPDNARPRPYAGALVADLRVAADALKK